MVQSCSVIVTTDIVPNKLFSFVSTIGVRKGKNAVGREAIEGLHFLASIPRAGARREKTQPFNWIHSRLFIWHVKSLVIVTT